MRFFEFPQIYQGDNLQELLKLFLQARDLKADLICNSQHALSELPSPFMLKNMQKAVHRIGLALHNQETIGLICDHDCDGQSACSVLKRGLLDIFGLDEQKLIVYIGHRTAEGYGISEKLLQRILQSPQLPSLLITADCGSNDESAISIFKQRNIDVIVTDHHMIGLKGPAASAYAVINPQQTDCSFPDKMMAGCAIAWMLLWGLKQHIEAAGFALETLSSLLDYVALGTIADCVSLKSSVFNRAIVRYGLKKIAQGHRPCWRVLKHVFNQKADSTYLSFKVIPLINADGRLEDGLTGIEFLCAQDMVYAQQKLSILIETNDYRKALQLRQMKLIYEKIDRTAAVCVVNLGDQGHHGIHGISAGRCAEELGKMAFVFSQTSLDSCKGPILSASARSPQAYNLLELLNEIHEQDSSIFIRYGGHAQAAGLSLYATNIQRFEDLAQKVFFKLYGQQADHRTISFRVDLYLPCALWSEERFFEKFYESLEPFGKDFVLPVLAFKMRVLAVRLLGQEKNHLEVLWHTRSGKVVKSMLFFSKSIDFFRSRIGTELFAIGTISFDRFRQQDQVNFHLSAVIDSDHAVCVESRSSEMMVCSILSKSMEPNCLLSLEAVI